MSEDESLLKEFMAESSEHLTRTEADLTVLARDGAKADAEVVRRIFRALHTIKGSSGFFGYTRIGAVAHAMESLLDRLRDGRVQPTKDVVDALFEGLDRLANLFADVERSNEADTADIESRIRALVPRNRHRKDAARKGPQDQDASGQIPRGHHLYRLLFDGKVCVPAERTTVLRKLEGLGKVHEEEDASTPDAAGDGDEVWPVLFSSVLEKGLVEVATGLPSDRVAELRAPTSSVVAPRPVVEPVVEPAVEALPSTAEPSSCEAMGEHAPIEPEPRPEEPETPASRAPARNADSDSRDVEYLKVRIDILDKLMALAGELVLVRNQHLMLSATENAETRGVTQRLDIVTSDLQETIMRTRMQPIGGIFGRFGRVVRDLGRKLGKEIAIETRGNDVELDKSILESLVDPLTHIVRNSCDHGIETGAARQAAGKDRVGRIVLGACHEGGQIVVEVRDDGRGIDRAAVRRKVLERRLKDEKELASLADAELLSMVFLPGFSTSEHVTSVSGRGVGMDVVKSNIEALGGTVEIQSTQGQGTCIRLRLPLTLAIIPSMIVETCGQRFAIPQINLEELVTLYDDDVLDRIECAGSREVFRLRDRLLTLFHLHDVLDRGTPFDETARRDATERHRRERRERGRVDTDAATGASLSFAVVKVGASRFGLVIDRIVGTEEIVVKPMHRVLKELSIYSGATVLGDGHVALILDVPAIARHGGFQMDEPEDNACDGAKTEDAVSEDIRRLLLFRNQPDEHLALPLEKVSRIEHVDVSALERIGDLKPGTRLQTRGDSDRKPPQAFGTEFLDPGQDRARSDSGGDFRLVQGRARTHPLEHQQLRGGIAGAGGGEPGAAAHGDQRPHHPRGRTLSGDLRRGRDGD